MKEIIYIILSFIFCFILSCFIAPYFNYSLFFVLGGLLIIIGIGGLWVLSENYIASIILIIIGVIIFVYDNYGWGFWGFFKEIFFWAFRIGY